MVNEFDIYNVLQAVAVIRTDNGLKLRPSELFNLDFLTKSYLGPAEKVKLL